jgi:hypothetical protein
MKLLKPLVAVFALAAFASQARAQGTISESPNAGCCSGTITVQGTISADCGWAPSVRSVLVRVWKDGLVVTEA